MTHSQFRDYSEPTEPERDDNSSNPDSISPSKIRDFENINWEDLFTEITNNTDTYTRMQGMSQDDPTYTALERSARQAGELTDTEDGILTSAELSILGNQNVVYLGLDGDVSFDGDEYTTYEAFHTKCEEIWKSLSNNTYKQNIDNTRDDNESAYMQGRELDESPKFVLKTPTATPAAPVAPAAPTMDMPAEPEMGGDPESAQAVNQELGDVENEVDGQDPIKTIQKLTGKLAEKIRTADENLITSEIIKATLNSVISAVDVSKLEDADLLDIIKNLKGEGEADDIGGDGEEISTEPNEFQDDGGIDYNANNSAAVEPDALREGLSIASIDTAISNEQDPKKKNQLTKIRGNVLHKIKLSTNQTKIAKEYGLINEEINEPTWDDQVMPNILGQVVSNIGVEVNEANEEELLQAVSLFVGTYGGDQNQTEFIKQLQDYVENSPANNGIANHDLRYSGLSPMGQEVFDQLELLDPSMGGLEGGEDQGTNTNFQTPTSNTTRMMAEGARSFLENKILEVLN